MAPTERAPQEAPPRQAPPNSMMASAPGKTQNTNANNNKFEVQQKSHVSHTSEPVDTSEQYTLKGFGIRLQESETNNTDVEPGTSQKSTMAQGTRPLSGVDKPATKVVQKVDTVPAKLEPCPVCSQQVENSYISVQGTVDLWSYILPIDRYSHML